MDASGLTLTIPKAFVEIVAQRALELIREQLPTASPATPWLDTREAADYLRIPFDTFKKKASAREVPVHVDGARLYFHRDELDAWRRTGSTHHTGR